MLDALTMSGFLPRLVSELSDEYSIVALFKCFPRGPHLVNSSKEAYKIQIEYVALSASQNPLQKLLALYFIHPFISIQP